MKKQNNNWNPKNTNEKQLFLKTRNGNNRSTRQQCTPKTEEGYCNEATQSGPLTHSQSHQAQITAEQTVVKQSHTLKTRAILPLLPQARRHYKLVRSLVSFSYSPWTDMQCTNTPKSKSCKAHFNQVCANVRLWSWQQQSVLVDVTSCGSLIGSREITCTYYFASMWLFFTINIQFLTVYVLWFPKVWLDEKATAQFSKATYNATASHWNAYIHF
jgi:hypothetical protein